MRPASSGSEACLKRCTAVASTVFEDVGGADFTRQLADVILRAHSAVSSFHQRLRRNSFASPSIELRSAATMTAVHNAVPVHQEQIFPNVTT